MNSISKTLLMLSISMSLSVSSPVQARSIFDMLSSDFDSKFPFIQLEEISGPRIESNVNENSVKVSVEVPGLDPSDLKVNITDDELFIEGEKKEEKEKRYKSFKRTITFPCRIDSEKAEAKLKNGVLTISAPKGPENGRRGKALTIQTN